MGWAETASETFVARHDERDAVDVERVLAQLEYGRGRLERQLEIELGELAVVLHGSPAQLDAAQPWIAIQRRLTAPAARRYVVGWAGERELHVLSPRLLAQRAHPRQPLETQRHRGEEVLLVAVVVHPKPLLRRSLKQTH